MESAPQAIAYTDVYGQSHTFRGISLYRLLSEEPGPKLVLGDISLLADESSPRSFALNYTLLSRGCLAQGISVEISTSVEGSVQNESLPAPPKELEALSQYKGRCYITVPEALSEREQVTFRLCVTYDHAAPLNASLTAVIGSVSSDPKPDIPLQGISLSPAPQLLLQPGDTRSLNVSYIPENTTDDRTVAFSSPDPDMPDPDIPGPDTPAANAPAPGIPNAPGADIPIAKGLTCTVKGMKYRITGTGKGAAAAVTLTGTSKRKSSLKSLTVRDTVTIGGKRFRVTAVGKAAFHGCFKLKTLQLGRYVKIVDRNNFRGCRSLKRLTIRFRQLKFIGKNAFRGISKRAVLRIPEGKRSRYRRLLAPPAPGFVPL